jgi:dienelactone hydrolase
VTLPRITTTAWIVIAAAILAGGGAAAEPGVEHRETLLGAYGPWYADAVLGAGPARLSFRSGAWDSPAAWRDAGRGRLRELLAAVDLGGPPTARVDETFEFDGLHVERLSWQLPCGPRTEAVLLKPIGAQGRLPAVLALHDHGGNKFLGWRKIARIDAEPPPVVAAHFAKYYEGVAWANELAKRGYAVLVPDAFLFGSRRVRVADVPASIRQDATDPEITDLAAVQRYNAFASHHEHVVAKSLFSAGTTWPGVFVTEDQRALDVLCGRPDVDPQRVGCCGLSGGGLRSVLLGGLDDRIRCAVPVGFMTTWRDLALNRSFTHTWMTYVPGLPRDLDFPEILALRVPAPTLVLNCEADALFTLDEMRRADQMLRETFARAGAADRYRCTFHPGKHKFDLAMQREAFDWLDLHLGAAEKP